MLLNKKIRLIWEEKIEAGYTSVVPKISFDSGNTWISLSTIAGSARTNSETYLSSQSTTDGFSEIDITFGSTIEVIPEIKDIVTTADASGFATGTWYFAVAALSYDTPGFADVDTDSYFNGSLSKLYEVELAEASKVDLYIRYPEYTKGLAIYWGQDDAGTVTLDLRHVTNLVQKLASELTDVGTLIELENEYPLPNNGTVKIDNEYIDYESCVWETDHWELQTLTRGQRSTTAATHTPGVGNEIEVYSTMYYGGSQGEIPLRLYPKPTISANTVSYLNFDNENTLNLVSGGSVPEIIGTEEYDDDFGVVGYSLKLTGNTVLKTNETLADTGSLHMLFTYIDHNVDTSVEGWESAKLLSTDVGYYIAISPVNNKLCFSLNNDIITGLTGEPFTIVGYDDMRTMSLRKYEKNQLLFTWEKVVIETEDKYNIVAYLNKYKLFELTIDYYALGDLNIGGELDESDNISNAFIGFLDEVRIYDTVLTLEDCNTIHNEIYNSDSYYCGKIAIPDPTDYPTLNADISGTKLQNYEPLIDKEFSTTTPATYGEDYDLILDNWFIDNFYGDSTIPSGEHLSYPIEINNIKIRFDLISDAEGFKTPKVRNVSTIVSEASLS